MHCTPRQMLDVLSYYKFAAKMIGQKKRVLDIGCGEGFGSWVLAKECGFCTGLDMDQEAIKVAQKNFNAPFIDFTCANFFNLQAGLWDAIVNFYVLEHIEKIQAKTFIKKIIDHLTPEGVAVIGTHSLISEQFLSPAPVQRSINLYSHERLYEELSCFFDHVFLFAANEEVIQTGFSPLAHFYVALCCKPKKTI
jgi:SAM-dependent methyltransferase